MFEMRQLSCTNTISIMNSTKLSQQELDEFDSMHGKAKLDLLFRLVEQSTKAFIQSGSQVSDLNTLLATYESLSDDDLRRNLIVHYLYDEMFSPEWDDYDIEALRQPDENESDFLKAKAESVLKIVEDYKVGVEYTEEKYVAALVGSEYVRAESMDYDRQKKELRVEYPESKLFIVTKHFGRDHTTLHIGYEEVN
ncbi:hypothetical protein DYH10_03510 [Candidatus Saccharibacteria bacterium CPR2]|nr:hypothetical protein [Candidatus Saccharibacteria bacterium CPR2]